MLHLVCCHLRLPVVIELVRLRHMAAAATCAGHEDKGLGFGGMRAEAWLGRNPST